MYSPTAAGHTAHEAPRTVAQSDISELVGIAHEWLETKPIWTKDRYEYAIKKTRSIKTNVVIAGCLALHPTLRQHEEYASLGVFISALWNKRCHNKIIIYPHETPKLNWLGYQLPIKKTFILTGTAGHNIGLDASGMLLLQGKFGKFAGMNATGPIIISGTGEPVGSQASGVLIAPRSVCTNSDFWGARIVPDGVWSHALAAYVSRLFTCATERPEAVVKEFGDGVAITKEIKRLNGGRA